MPARYDKKQKALILKALTDPKFRKALAANPAAALGAKIMTPEKRREVALLLAAIKGINAQIAALADELLCANGGPCGIA
jgi:hypothetical protein